MISIDPKLWGHSAWMLLHDVSFYVSFSNDKHIVHKAIAFFRTLTYILPCYTCQCSFDIHLLHMPFPSIKDAFPKWVFELHNRVNDSLEKKESPEWNSWSKEYPLQMKNHSLKDIWPFIQCIVEVHPEKSKDGQDIYRDNLEIFFKYLWEFLYKMDAYYEEKDIIREQFNKRKNIHKYSKSGFTEWITSIGKKIHSNVPKIGCSRTCYH